MANGNTKHNNLELPYGLEPYSASLQKKASPSKFQEQKCNECFATRSRAEDGCRRLFKPVCVTFKFRLLLRLGHRAVSLEVCSNPFHEIGGASTVYSLLEMDWLPFHAP